MNDYTKQLREHNLKATSQRLAISDILYSYGHVSIEFLHEKMCQKFDSISLATIYKNINLMLQNAYVQKVKIPNAKNVFELTNEAHSHLVCDICHTVQDISVDLSALKTTSAKQTHFQIDSASVVFSGRCEACQSSKG